MRKIYFLYACLITFALVNGIDVRAQNVGIGTTAPDASALLDLTSTTLGFLGPRVTTSQMNAIASPANGLLVFNSTANAFYFNAGTTVTPNWIPFLTSASGWGLTGNSGTNPGSDFLGTTDAKDLVFKTNGTERMRILSGGNIGIGTTSAAGYLDVAPSITATALATSYNLRSDPTLSGALGSAQTALYSLYSVPAINLTGGTSNTLTTLFNQYTGLTATAGTISTYYGSYIAAPTGSGTVTTKYALVTEANAGNVGIGTTTPTQKLDVTGSANVSANLIVGANQTVGGSSTVAGSSTISGSLSVALTSTLTGNETLNGAFMPNGLAGTAGNVLTSAGANTPPTWTDPNTTLWKLTGNSSTSPGTNFLGTTDAQDLILKTAATDRLHILSTGNVGIGVTAPTSILHTVASGVKTLNYTGNLLTNTATSSTSTIYKYGLEVLSSGAWSGTSDTNIGLHVNATGGTANVAALFEGGNVGVKTTSPATTVDINGDLALRYKNYSSMASGLNNNVAVGAYSFVRLAGNLGNDTLTGISGGTDGKVLVLYNTSTYTLTIANDNTSSTAANRIYTLSAGGTGDLSIVGKGAITLVYSAADSRWLCAAPPTSSTSVAAYTIKRKTSGQSVTSSTTLVNDNDLYFDVAANQVVEVDGFLDSYSTSSVGDIKIAFTAPAGAVLNVGYHCSWNGNTQANIEIGTLTVSGTASQIISLNGSNSNPIFVHGIIANSSTAGTIHLQFAQNTSSSTPVTLQANSFLKTTTIQ